MNQNNPCRYISNLLVACTLLLGAESSWVKIIREELAPYSN